MLGYVMTRTIEDAMASINQQLEEHHEKLQLRQPRELRESGILPDELQVKQTTHALVDGGFEIIHLFLKF